MKDLNCETSKEEALTAFMQVLEIDNSMAEFFLEAAAWNIEVAVMHYLESMQQGQSSSQLLAQQFSMGGVGAPERSGSRKAMRREKRFVSRDVLIHDMPEGWGARVSSTSGEIYFYHIESGHSQREVPPGFADMPDGGADKDDDISRDILKGSEDSSASGTNKNIMTSLPAFNLKHLSKDNLGIASTCATAGDNTFLGLDKVDKGASQSVASGIGQDADLTDDNTDAGVFGDAEGHDNELI